MDYRFGRRWVLRSGAAMAGAMLLPQSRSCEVQANFLRIFHPWTRATAPGSEYGVLCMRIFDVTADDRLIGVETPVAGGATLAQAPGQSLDLAIPEGTEIDMHEQGVHLRMAPLRLTLHSGRQYPLQLTFARSGVVLTTLSVDYDRFA